MEWLLLEHSDQVVFGWLKKEALQNYSDDEKKADPKKGKFSKEICEAAFISLRKKASRNKEAMAFITKCADGDIKSPREVKVIATNTMIDLAETRNERATNWLEFHSGNNEVREVLRKRKERQIMENGKAKDTRKKTSK